MPLANWDFIALDVPGVTLEICDQVSKVVVLMGTLLFFATLNPSSLWPLYSVLCSGPNLGGGRGAASGLFYAALPQSQEGQTEKGVAHRTAPPAVVALCGECQSTGWVESAAALL